MHQGVPETWYMQPQSTNRYNFASDLQFNPSTNFGLFSEDEMANHFLLDQYKDVWLQKSSYENWQTTKLKYTIQERDFFYDEELINKFAGSIFVDDVTRPGQDDLLEWHGFEISQSNPPLTSLKQDVELPNNLRQVKFTYQAETLDMAKIAALQAQNKVKYEPNITVCDGQYYKLGRLFVNTTIDYNSGYFVCLQPEYHRVIQIDFIGDTVVTIGSSQKKAAKWSTFTHEIPKNHNFLGFVTYHDQILMKDYYNATNTLGFAQQRWINLVSWIDIVTIDTIQERKRFCQVIPDLRVDTFLSDCDQVTLVWTKPEQRESYQYDYTIQYGKNWEYQVKVDPFAGTVTIRDNIYIGDMQFRLVVRVDDPICEVTFPRANYVVKSCLPDPPRDVSISLKGVCPAYREQMTIAWTPSAVNSALPVINYEVMLSHTQFGMYTRVDESCTLIGGGNWYTNKLQCMIDWTEVEKLSFSVGKPIFAKVVAVNKKGKAESLPSMAITVSDGPNPVSYLEAASQSKENTAAGILIRWFYINYMDFYQGSSSYSNTPSHTFTIRAKRVNDQAMVVVKDKVLPEQTVTGQVYTIPPTGSALGDLECGTQYIIEVLVESNGSS